MEGEGASDVEGGRGAGGEGQARSVAGGRGKGARMSDVEGGEGRGVEEDMLRMALDIALAVCPEREFFNDNLLVRIHFIIEMIWWTGLA